MKRNDRIILAIDLKSFYASVECVDRNMDPFSTPLVVADESRGDGTIVLAASPFIKEKYHVKSRCRLNEIDKNIPGLIIAQPKMVRYLEVSAQINDIYEEFVSQEDLFVYSIDESFLDVTNYLNIHRDTPKSYAKKIINLIKDRTGLTVTCGIGLNLFMAKAAMDIEAKHNSDFIAQWDYSSIPEHLWPVNPLRKMWGIGKQLEKKLNKLGFYTIGDIAASDPSYLPRIFGVIGEEIYYHSLGYDDALLQESYHAQNRSISCGQVLLRDFHTQEMPTLIREMALELSDKLYEEKVAAKEFAMYIGLKNHEGYGKKLSFYTPTDSAEKIGKGFCDKFLEDNLSENLLFRQIALVAIDVQDGQSYQLSLFEDEENDCKIRRLEETLIQIRKNYGTVKAMPCSALTFSSTFIDRRNQIGGHHA